MADLADIAENNNNFTECAVEKAVTAAKTAYRKSDHCRSCGVQLHPVRVEYGRCLRCAERIERHQ